MRTSSDAPNLQQVAKPAERKRYPILDWAYYHGPNAQRLATIASLVVGNCTVVGWRTDILNHTSQRAIERLGAQRDGVLRSHALRRDGSIRDTVMYSLLASEWPDVRARLSARLQAPSAPLPAGD